MSAIVHKRYPTLTNEERRSLYNQIQNRQKLSFMLNRLVHKEQQQLGRRMVAKRIRALLYERSLDPLGERFYKRPAPWKCVIKAPDIAYLLRINIRYAQEKLKELKDELGKKYVTVNEFCVAYNFDEEYVQRLLNDGEAREYNSPKWQRQIDAINRRHEEEIRKVKEAMAKEKEAEAKKNIVAPDKKEAPPKEDDKKKKSPGPKKRPKSFDEKDHE